MTTAASVFSTAADLLEQPLRAPWRCYRPDCDGTPHDIWTGKHARANQLPPAGDWLVWLILAGRGWGKTRTGAEWAAGKARRYPGCRIALVASTFADGRDTMVEGESGLLSVLDESELRGGSIDRAWNRSLGELYLANGSRFKIYSSERPRQLRGPQHHFSWGDEPAYWLDAGVGPAKDSTWSNLKIGTRLPRKPGWPDDYRTQTVLTTTPRQVALLRSEAGKTDRLKAGLMQDPLVTITHGRTMDNLTNLTDEYRAAVIDPMLGTRLGQQELDAIMLEDVEGALWTSELIEADRVTAGVITNFRRVIVSVDPATTNTKESDETGIVACASGEEPGHLLRPSPELHGYVLADQSGHYSPHEWGEKACLLAHEIRADAIVVEDNQGGEMTETIIRDAWTRLLLLKKVTGPCPAVRRVRAKVGKRLRAEPIAAIYEKHRIHHMGYFPTMESQQTTWVPGEDSPDRLDALVHGFTDLLGTAVHAVGGSRPKDRRLAGRR